MFVSLEVGSPPFAGTGTGAAVEDGPAQEKPVVEVLFSWKIPARYAEALGVLDWLDDDEKLLVGIMLLLLLLLVVNELVEDTIVVDETDVEVLVDELDVVVGATELVVGVLDVVGAGVDELDEELEELDELADPSEPSRLKTTIFALPPFGTVTTQKSEPPAPVALLSLLTPDPSISHFAPLQPP